MIKNWEFQKLNMDFSTGMGKDHPSDIDMFYVCKDNTLILGEIKNYLDKDRFTYGQRKLYEKLATGHKGKAVIIFALHTKFVQNGDRTVDVMDLPVEEVWWNCEGGWRKPTKPITVGQAIRQLKQESEEQNK